jgi:hypothetical protein
MSRTSSEQSRAEAIAEFRRRSEAIARWLGNESTHIGGIENVTVNEQSIGSDEAVLTVYEGGPDKRFEIRISGTPNEPDDRMTVRASFGKTLQAETNYSDDTPRIGVSVMSRAPETAAGDIERRLLPDAVELYNTLLSRLRRHRKRDQRREAVADEISSETSLELTESRERGCYYSDRIFFEREEPSGRKKPRSQRQIEPKLHVRLEGRGALTLEVENLSPEDAMALVKAAEEEIDGPICQQPPRKRSG